MMKALIVILLVIIAVIIANILKKNDDKSKEESKEKQKEEIDEMLLNLRDFDPDIELQTLLEYYRFYDESKEKVKIRIMYFVSAHPKTVLKEILKLKRETADEEVISMLETMLIDSGFSVVFALADIYVDYIFDEYILDYVTEFLKNYEQVGIKKFFEYIEKEKSIHEEFKQVYYDDKKRLLLL